MAFLLVAAALMFVAHLEVKHQELLGDAQVSEGSEDDVS